MRVRGGKMSIRNRFPFDKIFEVIDKIISVAGLIKSILGVLRRKK